MAHLLDNPLPDGMFADDEAAIVRFAQKSALMQPIDDVTWADLNKHFTTKQILEISFVIGMDQLVSRFHAMVRTDVDGVTMDQLAGTCQVQLPPPPPPADEDAA